MSHYSKIRQNTDNILKCPT